MDSKLSRWCDGFIEAGWLAAIIAAPLFFNIHSERVFEPDKLTIVRSLSVLMLIAWLVRFLDQQGWQNLNRLDPRNAASIWRRPFALPVFLLVVSYVVSTIFSVVPQVSWAGSYQRLQGTYTTLSYIVIFALVAATIRRREQVNRLVTTVIITSIPISLYALLQHFGLDPLPWGGNVQRRVAGHMGNAIFIAAYLIMAVPLTISRIIDAFTNILGEEELSNADVVRSSVYIFTLAIQLLAIYWSGSRGPMLGLIVGAFAFILILLVSLRNSLQDETRFGLVDVGKAAALVIGGTIIGYLLLSLITPALLEGAMASFVAFVAALGVVAVSIFILLAARRGWRWLWLGWILLVAVVGLWLGLFNLPEETAENFLDTPIIGGMLETMAEWKALPTVGRFGSILESEEGTGRVRVLIWQGALELLAPHDPLQKPDGTTDTFNFLRPIIGYGPESMYVAYNRFYQPELANIEARNASPDRSHNETFDALIITGIAGFLIWQALYLSVFYYGFRWLGVVRTNRDRNLLIGLWIAGAGIGAVVITQLLGLPFLGVSIPFGSIGGLILYLIYYALFASTSDEQPEADPFQVDRLLMMGLLAAVLAHYVEIHFGIAIAATRTHFFVYVALMFLIGHLLPQLQAPPAEAAPEKPTKSRRKRRRRRTAPSAGANRPGWVAPVLSYTYTLTLTIGILGYEFLNYVLQGELETIADVPTAAEIIHQAFFINAQQNFTPSPFIFLVITLSWALGTLLSLSELAKQGIIKKPVAEFRALVANRPRLTAAIYALLLVGSLVIVVLRRSASPGVLTLLGLVLVTVWGALCLIAMILLFMNRPQARFFAGVVAMIGFLVSFPIMVTGAWWFALAMLAACGTILYLLWDTAWQNFLTPAGIIGGLSWIIGFGYVYIQASLLRGAFIGPAGTGLTEVDRQVLATDQYITFLTLFYFFVILLSLSAAFFLAQTKTQSRLSLGTGVALTAVFVLFIAGLYAVSRSNIRIIQADMVYKRARPLERLARRQRTPEAWDFPIAIYEHAIDLAPREDFYYLFLGAAYLEKSSVTPAGPEQETILQTANDRLQSAQDLNPLNTDHTANLARLTTRWAAFSRDDPSRQAELIQQATQYYERALALSPRNTAIWNEYANLLVTMAGDCDEGIANFQHSLEIDPFYDVTYLSLAGAYEICADQVAEGEQAEYYRLAAETLEEGMAVFNRDQASYWVQAGRNYRRADDFDQAFTALAEARALGDPAVPAWQIDFEEARVYRRMGDIDTARQLALNALGSAPAEQQAEIQSFIDNLTP